MDSLTWAERETKFAKKFEIGDKYIRSLFKGLDLPPKHERIALLFYASKKNNLSLGGAQLQLVTELMKQVRERVAEESNHNLNISEQYVILRSIQFAEYCWRKSGTL